MALYARRGPRLVAQVAADLLVAVWAVGWWLAGRGVDAAILALAAPARQASVTASDLQRQLADAAARVATVPVVGDGLRQPFDSMAASLDGLISAAGTQAADLERVAGLAGALVFGVPLLCALAVWLPARLRFVARSRRLAALASDPRGTDLLALRALADLPLTDLATVAPDPAAAWRSGDPVAIGRLAALELERAGVRPPR